MCINAIITRIKLMRMFNIIVYDNTQIDKNIESIEMPPDEVLRLHGAEPGSYTWWWELGGVFQKARKLTDVIGDASDWDTALQFVVDAVYEERSRIGKNIQAGVVQFWSHGSPGQATIGGTILNEELLKEGSEQLDNFKKVLIPGKSSVWFRCCQAFQNPKGKNFANKLVDFSNCKVIGHTYKILFYQSGIHILSPGEIPDWPDDEGTEGDQWSYPSAPNTITALRFYPPLHFLL